MERNGQLDLGIPSDVKRVAKREDGRAVDRVLTPEEQDVVNSLVGELDRQEADHVELASACSKVIDIFEASLSRMDADQATRAQMSADPPATLAQWNTEAAQSGGRGRQDREEEEEEEEEIRKRSRNNSALPKESVTVLKEWLFSHVENPYPTQVQCIASSSSSSSSLSCVRACADCVSCAERQGFDGGADWAVHQANQQLVHQCAQAAFARR